MIPLELQCINCKNFIEKSNSCKAFPNGIDTEIMYGFIIHDKPLDGQAGTTVYEEK